jgi:AcrR family transcriptional regulator
MKKTIKVDRETRRDQISRAALKIVGLSGVKGLTTAAIAKEVGISEAALYRHFKNKDEILLETLDKIGDGLKEKIEEVMKSDIPCLEKLKANFLLNLEHIENNIGIPRLVFSDQIHIGNEVLREKLLQNINGHSKRLEMMIASCQSKGNIRKDIEPKAAAIMLLGMIQTLAMRWSLNNFSFSLPEAGNHLWDNYEKCLRPNK